jgi:hypothetical protein
VNAELLKNVFANRFQEFCKISLAMFTVPCNVYVCKAEGDTQMSLLDLKCHSLVKETFSDVVVQNFYICTPDFQKLFNLLAKYGRYLVAHICVNGSLTKRNKNSERSRLTDRLELLVMNVGTARN